MQALSAIEIEQKGTIVEKDDGLNVEGLAIDGSGYAYIGLRNPLLKIGNQGYAIVVRMTVENIFAASPPQTETIALRLEDSGKDYGITSLEYDQKTGAIVVLGNSPKKDEFFLPKLWIWHPNKHHIQTPTLVRGRYLRMPEKFYAKPEALVLDELRAFIFIDAPGHGGERVFRRKEIGL